MEIDLTAGMEVDGCPVKGVRISKNGTEEEYIHKHDGLWITKEKEGKSKTNLEMLGFLLDNKEDIDIDCEETCTLKKVELKGWLRKKVVPPLALRN